MDNLFDHPLILALIAQREAALNNCAALSARITELEAQVAQLRDHIRLSG